MDAATREEELSQIEGDSSAQLEALDENLKILETGLIEGEAGLSNSSHPQKKRCSVYNLT